MGNARPPFDPSCAGYTGGTNPEPPPNVLATVSAQTPVVLDREGRGYGWRILRHPDVGSMNDLSGASRPYRVYLGPVIFEGEDPAKVAKMALATIRGVWTMLSEAALGLAQRAWGAAVRFVRWLCPTCFDRAGHARPVLGRPLPRVSPPGYVDYLAPRYRYNDGVSD